MENNSRVAPVAVCSLYSAKWDTRKLIFFRDRLSHKFSYIFEEFIEANETTLLTIILIARQGEGFEK